MVNRRDFIRGTGAAGMAATAGCVGSLTGGDGAQTLEKVGVSSYTRGGSWVQAFWQAGEFYAQDNGVDWNLTRNTESVQQMVQSINQFVNQGMDGIIAAVWQSDAADEPIANAKENGIPVFTADGDAKTPDVTMHVGFDNALAGETCADELISKLREQKPDQSPYTVLNFRGPLEGEVASLRNEGFVNRVDEIDDLEIVQTINAKHAREEAQARALEYLNANDPPDAIHASNLSMGLGIQTALKRQDLQFPRENDKHITQSQLDAGPEVMDLIDQGYIDVAVDQPNYFYMPIALFYMKRYIEGDGEDEIPEVGTTITADDLTIEPSKHEINGETVTLWEEPIWAPAKIVDAHGHPRFQTEGIVVDQTNTDNPYLYGNIWG